MDFIHEKGNTYITTGVDRRGKRFTHVTTNPHQFIGINLYRGSRWIKRHDGSRKLLERIYN